MATVSPLPGLFTHPRVNGHRLLLAFTEKEADRFFPHQDLRVLPPSWKRAYREAPSTGEWASLLSDFQPTILVSAWSTPPIPEAFIRASDLSLRYLCHLCGSVRATAPRLLFQRGVIATNWGELAAPSVAEHALLLCLAALRNTRHWREWLSVPIADRWVHKDETIFPRSLAGRRIGIHGFGRIARRVAALIKAFGAPVSAYSEGVDPRLIVAEGVTACGSAAELFAQNDVLFECEALTERTRQCVGAPLLELLPVGAIFVNVGRGAIVDELALTRLAQAGRLRLALDVYTQEPLPADSPLLSLPDAILSPHIGGPAMDVYPQVGSHIVENLRRYLDGQTLLSLITLEDYDRST